MASNGAHKYVDFASLQEYDRLLKNWIHISGYYYNGDFYEDAAHTETKKIKKSLGNLYIDLGSTTKDLYRCKPDTEGKPGDYEKIALKVIEVEIDL